MSGHGETMPIPCPKCPPGEHMIQVCGRLRLAAGR
jgi:hypothetical protein